MRLARLRERVSREAPTFSEFVRRPAGRDLPRTAPRSARDLPTLIPEAARDAPMLADSFGRFHGIGIS